MERANQGSLPGRVRDMLSHLAFLISGAQTPGQLRLCAGLLGQLLDGGPSDA